MTCLKTRVENRKWDYRASGQVITNRSPSEVSAEKLGAKGSILSHVTYFLLWLYYRCELMLFRMGNVSRELWLYLGPAWKRFVNGDCIFFFCLLNYTGLPNHREITVWEIRRSLMCLKTLSKSGVGIYKLFFALHLYLLLFIFHVPYQEKKQEKTFSTSWCP